MNTATKNNNAVSPSGSSTVLRVIGWLLVILFPLLGLIYGLIYWQVKGDEHGKYMAIVAAVWLVLWYLIFL